MLVSKALIYIELDVVTHYMGLRERGEGKGAIGKRFAWVLKTYPFLSLYSI